MRCSILAWLCWVSSTEPHLRPQRLQYLGMFTKSSTGKKQKPTAKINWYCYKVLSCHGEWGIFLAALHSPSVPRPMSGTRGRHLLPSRHAEHGHRQPIPAPCCLRAGPMPSTPATVGYLSHTSCKPQAPDPQGHSGGQTQGSQASSPCQPHLAHGTQCYS